MITHQKNIESAINRGIKTVGIGKKGSKHLSPELAKEILAQLRTDKIPPAAKGAFFAGLINKGVAPEEKILEKAFAPGIFTDSNRLVEFLSKDAPEFVQKICTQILNQQTLDRQTAYQLGKFLF